MKLATINVMKDDLLEQWSNLMHTLLAGPQLPIYQCQHEQPEATEQQ
jgi:hypothetical protein